jgi:hypothetical protein
MPICEQTPGLEKSINDRGCIPNTLEIFLAKLIGTPAGSNIAISV